MRIYAIAVVLVIASTLAAIIQGKFERNWSSSERINDASPDFVQHEYDFPDLDENYYGT